MSPSNQNMKKKTIWIIAFNFLHRDPRVYRQIQWLSQEYNIVTFGFTPSGIPSTSHIQLIPPPKPYAWYHPKKWLQRFRIASLLLSKRFDAYYWSCPLHQQALHALENAITPTPDLIIANDLETLPLALKVSKGNKLLIDLHEYAPRECEDQWKWRLFFQPHIHHLCKNYLPKTSASFTVCKGIADEYNKNYGIQPKVLTNAPSFHDLSPTPLKNHHIHMIYHGVAIPSRRIEDTITLMHHLEDRFLLDIILVPGNNAYIQKIIKMAKGNSNIRFLPLQPMPDLPRFLNQYDIGLFYLPPTNFNYLHALPNKFFEFIQARIAIAIGPSPEMAEYVTKYNCGIVSESFNPLLLAKKLNTLTAEQIMIFKQNSHKAARSLNAENNGPLITETVHSLLK